jgi:hypothetical protein
MGESLKRNGKERNESGSAAEFAFPGALHARVTLLEFVDPARGIDQAFFPGENRVAVGGHGALHHVVFLPVDLLGLVALHSGAGDVAFAGGGVHENYGVKGGMSFLFHGKKMVLCWCVLAEMVKKFSRARSDNPGPGYGCWSFVLTPEPASGPA